MDCKADIYSHSLESFFLVLPASQHSPPGAKAQGTKMQAAGLQAQPSYPRKRVSSNRRRKNDRERHGVLGHPLSRMTTSELGAAPFDHISTTRAWHAHP